MRAYKFFLFLLLINTIMIVSSLQALAEKQIEVVFQVSLDELRKEVPAELTMYHCTSDEAGITQREALQSFFGKDAYFELQKASGGIFTGDMERLWAQPVGFSDERKAPDEKLILSAVEKFLETINGRPKEQKTVRHVTTDTMELMDKKGERLSLPMSVNVTYRRLLEGYEVVGPGGKLKIYHDLNGDVVGYQRVWRKLRPEKEKQPIISLGQAVKQFEENPLGRTLLDDVDKVEVTEIRIAYLENGIAVTQRFLQPIYLFSCIAHVKSGDRTTQTPYVRYMEALVDPPEALWPSGRKHEAQARPKTKAKPGED